MTSGELMEKEVIVRYISLLSIAILFITLFLSFVFAQSDETTPTSDQNTGVPVPPTVLTDPVQGYWIVCAGDSPDTCTYIPEQTNLIDATGWDQGLPGAMYPIGIPNPLANRDIPLTLNMKYLYANGKSDSTPGFKDYFTAGNPQEIFKVKFVLTPLPFTRADTTRIISTHGGSGENLADLISNYQTKWLLSCDSIEDIDKCMADFKTSQGTTIVARSAIEVNILMHKNCTIVSDLNLQFCEGVESAGANIDNTPNGPISNTGIPGYGGCYVITPGDSGGRDWFWSDANPIAPKDKLTPGISLLLSPDFLVSDVEKENIGRCCGNDPEDYGALIMHNDKVYRNNYICINDTALPNPGPAWVEPRGSGRSFRIYDVNRPLGAVNVSFEVISNYDSWFVCGGLNPSLDSLYKRIKFTPDHKWNWNTANSGPLLNEFDTIPNTEQTISYGTTEAQGGEESVGGINGVAGNDDNSLGGGSTSKTEVVTADEFESTIGNVGGATQVTPCDKDGDGYDGYWTIDPAATAWDKSDPDKWLTSEHPINPWKDSSGICDSPRPPYDCDDFRRDISPGTIDYCDGSEPIPNTIDNDCNITAPCIPGIPGEDPTSPEFHPETLVPRFICHDVDGTGSFAECCGWNLGDCSNNNSGRREGSAIHTLNEFTNVLPGLSASYQPNLKANVVLQYGVKHPETDAGVLPDSYYTLGLSAPGFDEKIQNWSNFKTFEFDFYSTTSYDTEIWIGFLNPAYANDPDMAGLLNSYVFPFKAKIFDYAVGDLKLRKWVHVVIPKEDIFSGGDFKVDAIIFASNILKLYNGGQGPSVMARIPLSAPQESQYSNVIGIDKLMLKAIDARLKSAENYYCAGTWPPSWISDLDDSSKEGVEQKGKAACNSIPSYRWTGNYCCGDDNGEDTSTKTKGQFTFKEWYNDTEGACWGGRYMANDERAMLLQYRMKYAPNVNNLINVSCGNYSCTYGLPTQASVIIENPHTDIYGLSFVDGGITNIGKGGVAPADAMLRAYDVPLQVQFSKGQFYTCNVNDISYLYDVFNTNTPSKTLLLKDTAHKFSSCQVQGIYFCDNINGSNHGWDNEPVLKYPDANLTMRDGTQMEFIDGTKDVTIIPATNRIEAKSGYNLIRNGGFENV